MTSEEFKKKIEQMVCNFIDSENGFQDGQVDDRFVSLLVNISNGKLPDISDKNYDGLRLVNGGL